MSLKGSCRTVSGIVIVDLCGRITLGEGERVLRETIQDLLIKGRRKILLNLSEVSYVDSSGIHELVKAFTAVRRSGGTIKLFHNQKKVHDLLQVTKLYTIYEVFGDEASALLSFGYLRYCRCPSCRSRSWPPVALDREQRWSEQTCLKCQARFSVRMADKGRTRMTIEYFCLQTYEREYLEVVPGPPYEMRIVGRLDLFSSSALERVWRTIPQPRRVVFNLNRATDIDAPGQDALLRFLRNKNNEKGAKAVILLEVLDETFAGAFLAAPDTYADKQKAFAALGDISDTAEWLAELVEVKS